MLPKDPWTKTNGRKSSNLIKRHDPICHLIIYALKKVTLSFYPPNFRWGRNNGGGGGGGNFGGGGGYGGGFFCVVL